MKRKSIFLALTLMILSAANVNAQVRIGGDADPNESAVLDLNGTNTTNNGTLGLALPRVELTSTANFAPLKAHVAGMTVYNTKTVGDVTPGAYYNDGAKWIRIGSGSLISEVDGIVGNEVANATSSGGLTRSGSGTATDPYTLGIAADGVTTARIIDSAVTSAKIENGAVTADDLATGSVTNTKLHAMNATTGQVLRHNGSTWLPATLSASEIGGCVKQVLWGIATASGYIATVTHSSVVLDKSVVILNGDKGDVRLTARSSTSIGISHGVATGTFSWQIVEYY